MKRSLREPRPSLVVVVLRDGGLHCDGAGHGRLLPEEGRARPEGVPGNVPQRQEQRRARTVPVGDTQRERERETQRVGDPTGLFCHP